ncbi:MAG: uroporphyrinogen-III C-methyltransferase, partial [Phycisphaerae bacterium]|nr:uroporphyrinogen-III C-methyltransferase [Phycisphaerae bacterium]
VYDRLVNPELLKHCSPDTELIFAGKSPRQHVMSQEQISQLLVDRGTAGKIVVRLKGGDPMIFGRACEEAAALHKAGVAFRIVPGITAALGAAAYTGAALTDRRFGNTLAFVTGHEDPAREESAVDFVALAGIDTVIFYMSVGNLPGIVEKLIAAGKPTDTPAIIVENATTPNQRTISATLETLPEAAAAKNVAPPAVIVVGAATQTHEQLGWFENLPLFGRTILVTRSRKQISRLAGQLRELGANVIEAPTIEIKPIADDTLFLEILESMRGQPYDWVVFTSPNGVSEFVSQLTRHSCDARILGRSMIAAVGKATDDELRKVFLSADLVPAEFTTRQLGNELTRFANLDGKRVLLVRSDIATPELPEILTAANAIITELPIYRTTLPETLPPAAVGALQNATADWITFTSSSTVDNFVQLTGDLELQHAANLKFAVIGPVTAQTLQRYNLKPTAKANPYTIDALVEAILAAEC